MAKKQTKRASKRTTKRSSTQRARPRARARSSNGTPANREIIILRAADIVIDDAWNARAFDTPYGTGATIKGEWPEEPERPLTDAQLEDSIRRLGLLSPPVVRCIDPAEATYAVVSGSRRVRACVAINPDWEIECLEEPERRRKDDADFFASAANLAENMIRRDLRPFEIADKLFRMHKERPDLTIADLAATTSISKSYCYNLIRARKHASDEMWRIFCAHGARYAAGITFKDFLSIVTKNPKGKQLEEWTRLVERRTSPAKGNASGATAEPRSKRLTPAELERCLAEVDQPANLFEGGVRFALLVALGRADWTKRTVQAGNAAQSLERKNKKKGPPTPTVQRTNPRGPGAGGLTAPIVSGTGGAPKKTAKKTTNKSNGASRARKGKTK